MSRCEFCDKDVMLPFTCPFCAGKFCMEHRLPENHSCPNAPARTPLGRLEAKKPKPAKLPPTPIYSFDKSTRPKATPKTKRRLALKRFHYRLSFWQCLLAGVVIWILLDYLFGWIVKSLLLPGGYDTWILMFHFAPLLVIGYFIGVVVQILVLSVLIYGVFWILRKE